MRARVLGAAVLAMAAALAPAVPALAAGPYPPPSSVTAQADPDRLSPGQCTTFSGTGFDPLTTLALADNGASRGSTRTDLSGDFSTQLCFANDAKRGRHTLTATGATSTGTQTASATVQVVGVSQSAAANGQRSGAGTTGAGTGAAGGAAPAAAAADLPLLPRTDGSAGPGVSRPFVGTADESSSLLSGLAGLVLPLLLALALALFALLLLVMDRRHRRERAGALAFA